MHNLYAIFAKFLDICKMFSADLVNEKGNIPRRGVVPKFSDLEVISLSLAAESIGIDSESFLFSKLNEYKDDGGEAIFCIDSMPIEVCRPIRSKRCKMGKNNYAKAPNYGYCASQGKHYYGYKLHSLCGLSGVIHSFDLTKIHIDSIKQKGSDVDPDWYTYEEIINKYGLSKDQISYTLKNYDVRTEKRGKFTMIYRTDFDKITQQRMGNTKKAENADGTERVVFQPKAQEKVCPPTPEEYYSTEEVAEMFKISIRHVSVMTRENKTPKIAQKCFNFYEKKAIDILYNQKNKYADINDWITPEEMRTTYKMTFDAVRSFIHRHKIPSKVEYGVTYYSKQHIHELKTGYFEGRERYYSVEEAMKKYGMTKDIVHYYVKQYKVTKVKRGQFMFFRKEEFDRLMEKRFKSDDLIANYTE